MSMPNTNDVHQANENSVRDAFGHFRPGNPGGPGNPFARYTAEMREAFVNRASKERLERIADKFLDLAEQGNVQAAKLVLSYVIGKPLPAHEPDKMDADEWQGYQNTAVMKGQAAALCNAGEPDFHLRTVRVMRPIVTQMMQKQLPDVANESPEDKEKREAAEAAEVERILSSPSPDGMTLEDIKAGMPPPNRKKRRATHPSPNGDFSAPSPNGKKQRDPATPHCDAASLDVANGRFKRG